MAPKFKGDSDDWLDDDDAASSVRRGGVRRPAAKKPPGRSQPLPLNEANATVAEVYPKLCRARLDDGGEVLCSYRRAQIFGQTEGPRERAPVAVGDRVKVEVDPQNPSKDGVIVGLAARRNFLARPAPGIEGKEVLHVISANVDQLVIVASAGLPEFTPGLVDRFLISAQAAGIDVLICVNKVDLLNPEAQNAKPWALYQRFGYKVAEVSSKRGTGLDGLRAELLGKTVVFCGQSGVGKTSVLRALTGKEIGKVGDVSEATSKGKHTTTSAVLLEVDEPGTQWIDTPGIREFGLSGVEPETLKVYFPEFTELRCEHSDCLHESEPGCQATGLSRYASYRRILTSLRSGEH